MQKPILAEAEGGKMKRPCVYAIFVAGAPIFYIGQAGDFEMRRRSHLYGLRSGSSNNPRLQGAYDLHGEESFNFVMLEVFSERSEDVRLRLDCETMLIRLLRPPLNQPDPWTMRKKPKKNTVDNSAPWCTLYGRLIGPKPGREKAKETIMTTKSAKQYRPTVVARIPSDISASKHAEILGKIEAINEKLTQFSCPRKEDAVERAAIMLSGSGVGACGYASAI